MFDSDRFALAEFENVILWLNQVIYAYVPFKKLKKKILKILIFFHWAEFEIKNDTTMNSAVISI